MIDLKESEINQLLVSNNQTTVVNNNQATTPDNLRDYETRQDIHMDMYDEPMKPWETDGQNYSFTCCTEFKQNQQKKNIDEVNTVFHKTNSQRLIVKRKDKTSSLQSVRETCILQCKVTILVFILGVLLVALRYVIVATIFIKKEKHVEYVDVCMIFSSFIMYCWCRSRKLFREDQQIITQSIPIQSIFYVERTVSKTEHQEQCCCSTPEVAGIQYSYISIGYNRSCLSSKFQGSATTE
eukprot:36380_1